MRPPQPRLWLILALAGVMATTLSTRASADILKYFKLYKMTPTGELTFYKNYHACPKGYTEDNGTCQPAFINGSCPKGVKKCTLVMKTSGGGASATKGTSSKTTTKKKSSSSGKAGATAKPSPPPGKKGSITEYYDYFDAASKEYHVPLALLLAFARVESAFDPSAVSSAGACGLMQLLPSTAHGMGVEDIFDPEDNIYGGAKYIRLLANKFDGDMVWTISSYHAGPGAVAKKGSIPYEKTDWYVKKVLDYYYLYKEKYPSGF